MNLGAYVLAADPAWLIASVKSYYDAVDCIVVSYDESERSWTGAPIAVAESLRQLRSIDHDGKLIFQPGHYARLDHDPLENDTYQRQVALSEASKHGRWVLQLDTDEVVASLDTFLASLEEADRRGFEGLEYPARNLYQHVDGDRYLERCRRDWGPSANYPGPVAIRGNPQLRLCRQADVSLFRIDFARRNTDPAHPKSAPVHKVVGTHEGILHFSWVRSASNMRRKARSSGHVGDLNWAKSIDRWEWRKRHPYLAVAATPFRRERDWTDVKWLRLTRVADVWDSVEMGS